MRVGVIQSDFEIAWGYYESIGMVRQLMAGRMFPLTLDGLDRAMRALSR